MRENGGWQRQTASYSSGLRMCHTKDKLIMFCNCRERRRKVVIERSEGMSDEEEESKKHEANTMKHQELM